MTTHNAANERIKRQYLAYLREAKRYSEASLDGVAKALHRFESYHRFREFRKFQIDQAISFKAHLAGQTSQRTKEGLSKATLYSTLAALRNFFHWLAGQPGFRSRISYGDADYFNLSEKDTRVAKARRERPAPTLEQIRHVLAILPPTSAIERRDRALIAFTALTGARDSAIASFRLKHIDIAQGLLEQDAREVKTKFSKTFTTWFFPVGDDVRAIVEDWVRYLRDKQLWGPDDPLFPATRIVVGSSRQFEASGLDRKPWSNAAPIRRIFKEAFARAGLPYFNPHSFRTTLAQLGEQRCRSAEEFKAWSQNLGHEKVLTTLTSYGRVAPTRQAEIIRSLGRPGPQKDDVAKLIQTLWEATRHPSQAP